MKEINFEDIKHMVSYVLDTKDEKLIQEYALALRQMRIDANDGIQYEYPTVELFNKRYYGNEVEVKKGKIYVDGVDTGEEDVEFDGEIKIGGNVVGGNAEYVKISGILTAKENLRAAKLYCDRLVVHGNVYVDGKLDCDDIHVDGMMTVNGKLSCDDIHSQANVNVTGNLSAEDITANNVNKKN